MRESDAHSGPGPRPTTVFRSALSSIASKERAVRTRRPDRAQALNGLSDRDLATLTQEFERLLHATADAAAMSESLHATLRTLSPETSDGEVGDA